MTKRPLAVALLFLVLFSSFARADDDTWKLMLQKDFEELEYISDYVDGVIQAMNPLVKQVRQDVATQRKKLDELLMLAKVSGSNPLELNSVVAGLDILSGQVGQAGGPLRQAAAEFKRFQDRLGELETEFTPQAAEAPSPELAKSLADLLGDLRKLKVKLARAKTVLDQGLGPTRDLENAIARSAKGISDRLPKARHDYYLASGRSLISVQAWTDAVQRLSDLPKFLVMYTNLFDSGREKLLGALWRLVGLSVVLIGAGYLALRRLRSRLPWLAPVSRPMACLVWASLAAAVSWAASGPGFVLVRSVTGAVAEILLARAMLSLAWFLRGLQLGEKAQGKNAVVMSWWVFSLAVFLQLPWLPQALRGTLWVVAMLGLGLWSKRRYRGPSASAVEAVAKQSGWVMPLLAVPALFGWLNLTLLVAMGWFLILVFLQTGIAASELLIRWLDKPRESSTQAALCALGEGLTPPAVGIVMFGLATGWLCSNLGGFATFAAVLDFDLGRGNLSIDLGRLAAIVLGFCLARALSRLADSVILQLPSTHPEMEKGVANLLDTISTYVVWGGFAISSLYLVGADFTSLAVVAGGLSVGIGFGMQHIINNFISGLILLFGRSIQAGDTLQIGEIWGVVTRVNIRNTVVQTVDNATLFVPNSELIAQKIINWSHHDRRVRRSVDVSVPYGADTVRVQDLLLLAAKSHPHVLVDPKPGVVFAAFGEGGILRFKLLLWIDDVDNAGRTCSDVRLKVEHLFRENGLAISS
ncbi:mechanosensitive ion channel [Fundidesulfovibrio butyratiphilus]